MRVYGILLSAGPVAAASKVGAKRMGGVFSNELNVRARDMI